jgi:hypothetical protein
MKLISPRIIEALIKCGFTVTGETIVKEKVPQPTGLWDSYYDECLGRDRTMKVLRRPDHMGGNEARRLVRSLMGIFKLIDNAPTEAVRQQARGILEELTA